jgi:hypothetical protein
MARSTLFKSFLLILSLGAANLPAQEPQEIPPPPAADYTVAPPDSNTLPPPPQFEWAPLGPKDEGGVGGGIETVSVPPPQEDPPIAPPPPAIIENPLPGGPDPNAMELVKPEVEIWRGDSQWPQIPARFSNWLDPAYVTGTEPVWLRVKFDPLAAGKRVLVRAGRGTTVNATGAALTISASGECLFQAQLAEGFNRSHICLYCEGIKTVLPVLRAPLLTVITVEEETGGGH